MVQEASDNKMSYLPGQIMTCVALINTTDTWDASVTSDASGISDASGASDASDASGVSGASDVSEASDTLELKCNWSN